jgi:DNA-binding transcriptional LysR family regulator
MSAQPDWDDLRLFLAVARAGSFTGAASIVGVHHTTVARRIEQLEVLLRTRLVDRQARGVRLTPAGEALLPHARQLEEDVVAATRTVAGHDQQLTRRVTLTTTTELVPPLVPLLAAFREAYPGVILALDTSGAMRDLGRREADVALRVTGTPPDEAIAWNLGPVTWGLYAAEHAADARIGMSDHLPRLTAWQRRRDYVPDVVVSTVATAAVAIGAGLGRGPLPSFLGDADPRLRRLEGPLSDVGGHLWLLVHTDLRRVARVRALVEHLRPGLAQLL